jgi:hypothetical protein
VRVDEAALKKFGLHMTFAPRFGWFKKAYDGVNSDPMLFSNEDAPKILGVGKNMVDAIQFWAQAFRIIEPSKGGKRTSQTGFVVTPFGRFIFDSENGVDPYLENPNSVYLLHWNALQAVSLLPVWWISFNQFPAIEFESEQLVTFALEQVMSSNWNFDNQNPIKKDVDCLLKMYAPRENQVRHTVDDFLDSPFRDLGLISQSVINRSAFRFEIGPKVGLSAGLVAAVCLDFVHRTSPDAKTATISRLTTDPGSPGRLLKLSDSALSELLIESSKIFKSGLFLNNPAGSTQINWTTDTMELANNYLQETFGQPLRGSIPKYGIGEKALSDLKLVQVQIDSEAPSVRTPKRVSKPTSKLPKKRTVKAAKVSKKNVKVRAK